MTSLVVAIQLILIRQFWSLIERISDKNLMEWIDHFQEKTKVSDAVAWELFQGLATSFPEMALTFIPIVFFGLNPVIWIAANVWSCVFNFMVVVWLPVLFSSKPLEIDKYEILRSMSYFIFILLALALSIVDWNISVREVSRIVLSRVIFMYFTIKIRPQLKTNRNLHVVSVEHDLIMEKQKHWKFITMTRYIPELIRTYIPHPEHKAWYIFKIPFWLFISLTIIWLAIYFLIWIVESLGITFWISLAFLSLTVLALITSLPELATNIPLAKKWKWNQILWNAVGSNSINIAIATCLMILFAAFIWGVSSFEVSDMHAILSAIYMLLGIAIWFMLLLRASKRKIWKLQWRLLIISYIIYIIISYFNFQA